MHVPVRHSSSMTHAMQALLKHTGVGLSQSALLTHATQEPLLQMSPVGH